MNDRGPSVCLQTIDCPICHAATGQRCTTMGGAAKKKRKAHTARRAVTAAIAK